MARDQRPDPRDRSPAGLALIFEHFGEVEAPQLDGHLYRALCRRVARDPEILAMAAKAPPDQPPPNLLFAAVHDLLIRGARHPLRAWYPALPSSPAAEAETARDADAAPPDPEDAWPAFRDFCLEHRPHIEQRVGARLTQTNVLQRCSALLPAFARVFAEGGRAGLGVLEIGPSAGLNLRWDRFRYVYTRPGGGPPVRTWGPADAAVHIPCELRGEGALPPLPEAIPVVWRRGIDLRPVDLADEDAVTWLRALVWPDHPGRPERLAAALALARRDPPPVVRGDAAALLPEWIARAPRDATLCITGTHTLYQFTPEALRATLRGMQEASREREIHFVSLEGTGDRCSELRHARYAAGRREVRLLARASPHGRWLEWL